MSKAKEFSKNIRQATESFDNAQKKLNDISTRRPAYKFGNTLLAQVSDIGGLSLQPCATDDSTWHNAEKSAIKFAQWIQDTFQEDKKHVTFHMADENIEKGE